MYNDKRTLVIVEWHASKWFLYPAVHGHFHIGIQFDHPTLNEEIHRALRDWYVSDFDMKAEDYLEKMLGHLDGPKEITQTTL